MSPDISEFSYGYALTESLISASPHSLRVAPVFPSLIEEGKSGGGFDVKVPFTGFPLFLQFKLSHYMVRDSANEVQKGVLNTPFYRMHLRPTKHSQQHPMLLDLEATGAVVYYAAPYFHKPSELNDAYAKREVVQRSIFIKPSDIGALPDDKDHHLAFQRGYPCYLCSDDPRLLREESEDKSGFVQDLQSGYYKRELIHPTEESAREWADRLENIVRDHRWYSMWANGEELDKFYQNKPLARFSYLASTFFGCSVVIVAKSDYK